MRCRKCNTELMEGDVFCPECGTKVDIQEPERIQSEQEKEPVQEADEKTEEELKPKKKFRKALIFGGAAAVIVLGGVFALGSGISVERSGDVEEILYVKDGGIYGASLRKLEEKPVEYTDDFLDVSEENPLSTLVVLDLPVTGRGRNSHFIPEKYDEDQTVTLFYQEGKKKPERISSGVFWDYQVTPDDKLVYTKKGDLYVSTPEGEEVKVDSEVSDCLVTPDGKMLFWTKSGEPREDGAKTYDYYAQDIEQEGRKKKIISSGMVIDYTEDMQKILFCKDDGLYLSRGLVQAEKVVSTEKEVSGIEVFGMDFERETFFYMTEGVRKVKASDYVNDDMLEADAKITKPNKADYETEIQGTYYNRTKVDDKYYTELEKYEEKARRDELRKELVEAEIEEPYGELYYYAGGESVLVTSELISVVVDMGPAAEEVMKNPECGSAVIYRERSSDGQEKETAIKLSQLRSVDQVQEMVQSREIGEEEYYLYSTGTAKKLDLDGNQKISEAKADTVNNQIYVLLKENSEEEDHGGELMTLGLTSETGELIPYETEVSSLELVYEGNVYYLKDEENGAGDLYRNEEEIDYEVQSGGIWGVPDTDGVIYLTDYEQEKTQGTLKLLTKGVEGVELGNDIYMGHQAFCSSGKDKIFMLADYDRNRGGDLLYFNGKETEIVDTDVTHYFMEDHPSCILWSAYGRNLYYYAIDSVYKAEAETEAATTAAAAEAADYSWYR